MLFRTIERLIQCGRTDGLAEKIDLFFAFSKLTQEEYSALVALL